MNEDKNESIKRRKIITPEFRIRYHTLFTPRAYKNKDGAKYFSVTMLFDKASDLSAIKLGIQAAVLEEFPDKTKRPPLKLPIKDGDADKPHIEGFNNTWFMSAKTGEKYPPIILDHAKRRITDEGEIYPGCYAVASLLARVYEVSGSFGVSLYLNGLMKTREGERFVNSAGSSSVYDDFSQVVVDQPADTDNIFE